MSSLPEYWLVSSGKFVSSTMPARDALRSFPAGAYTTMRTVNRTRIFDYDDHLERLSRTLEMNVAAFPWKSEAYFLVTEATYKQAIRAVVEPQMRQAVADFVKARNYAKEELRITLLFNMHKPPTKEKVFDIHVHLAVLPPVPRPPIKVQVEVLNRENPQAKSTDWVFKVADLEKAKAPDVNEIVMLQDDHFTEGLSSNFFAVLKDGTVQTAPWEMILPGTVQIVLLDACLKKGIPVSRTAPLLSQANEWQGAFITSTSRLVLPIDELFISKDRKQKVVFKYDKKCPTYQLRDLLLSHLEQYTQVVFDEGIWAGNHSLLSDHRDSSSAVQGAIARSSL